MRKEAGSVLLFTFLKDYQKVTNITEDNLVDIQKSEEFFKALEFFEKEHGEYLPLEAIASENPETAKEYQAHRATLFELLGKTLSFDKETLTFGAFEPKLARGCWIQAQKGLSIKLDTQKVQDRALHADSRNLAINEKFLRGELHGKEWLNEVDLQRLLSQVGLRDKVNITRLDAGEIGMALHFARKAHLNATAPYTVELLVNKGNAGDITSQGSHWLEARITVVPAKPAKPAKDGQPAQEAQPAQIKVELADSLAMSADEKTKVEAILRDAINFQEEIGTPPNNDFRAFPGATINAITIEAANTQKDGWSCGYHAFKKKIERMGYDVTEMTEIVENDDQARKYHTLYVKVENNVITYVCSGMDKPAVITAEELGKNIPATFNELAPLKNEILKITSARGHTQAIGMDNIDPNCQAKAKEILACQGTAELRDTVYQSLLSQVEVPESLIDKTQIPQGAYEGTDEKKRKIKSEYLEDYIVSVAKTSATSNPADLNPKALKEKIELDKKTTEQLNKIEQEFSEKIVKRDADGANAITLDAAELLASDVELDNKATSLALVQFLNAHKVAELTINNADKIKNTQQCGEHFEQLAYVTHFNLNGDNEELKKSCEVTVTRNQLMQHLKIAVDPEADVWQQLFHARLSNAGLYSAVAASRGELNVFSFGNSAINRFVIKAPERHLREQLRFLHEHKKFLETHPEQFTYNMFILEDRPLFEIYNFRSISLECDDAAVKAERMEEKKALFLNFLETHPDQWLQIVKKYSRDIFSQSPEFQKKGSLPSPEELKQHLAKITDPNDPSFVEMSRIEEAENQKAVFLDYLMNHRHLWSVIADYYTGDDNLVPLVNLLRSQKPVSREELAQYLATITDPDDAVRIEVGTATTASMRHDCCEVQLAVLAEHLSRKQYFPFKDINITISDLTPSAFEHLKTIIASLENYPHVNQITLGYNPAGCMFRDLSVEQYQALKDIYREKNLTTLFVISKPGFGEISLTEPEVAARYELTNTIAINRRNNNIEKLQAKKDSTLVSTSLEEEDITSFDSKQGPVRACKLQGFNARQAIAVDISVERQAEKQYQQQTQLQQETQLETQVQAQQQSEIQSGVAGTSSGNLITKDTVSKYYTALTNVASKQCPRLVVDDQLVFFWNQLVGSGELSNSIKYFTPGAMDAITTLPQYFENGFNIDNLPTGFFIQKFSDASDLSKEGYVLCYDATKYVENKNQSDITLCLKSRKDYERWLGDMRQFYRDPAAFDLAKESGKLLSFDDLIKPTTGSAYPKQATREKFVTLMTALDATLSQKIQQKHAWCLDSTTPPQVDAAVFKRPKEMYALTDLLYHQGCQGVERFLDTLKVLHDKDPDLYLHFKNHFICSEISDESVVMPLATDESVEIMRKLADLKPAEKIWWCRIVETQLNDVGYLDLVSLYKGFRHFLNALPARDMLPLTCPIGGRKLYVMAELPTTSVLRDMTVIVKDPLALFQFDENGNKSEIARGPALTDMLKHAHLHRLVESNVQPEECLAIRRDDNRGITAEYLGLFNDAIVSKGGRSIITKGPLVALDRLLAVLGTVPAKNLADQMNYVDGLDLGPEGAWYAARWDGFHFFHPKMALIASSFSSPEFMATGWEKNYRVDYDKLKKLADNPKEFSFEFAEIAFHRYLGRQAKIAVPYEQYVTLTTSLGQLKDVNPSTKIKLLPLLAVVTTGPRGSRQAVDASALFEYLQANANDKNLDNILAMITDKLKTLSEKPTLKELTALIQLIHKHPDAKTALDALTAEPLSEKILQSWSTWQSNTAHLSATEFVEFYSELGLADADHRENWAQIAAVLRGPCDKPTRDALVAGLTDPIRKQGQYVEVLKILASIDVEKTPADQLPTAAQITALFQDNAYTTLANANDALAFVSKKFPNCCFKIATTEAIAFNLGSALLEEIEMFNEQLIEYGIEPWDLEKLKGPNAAEEIVKQYDNLYNQQLEKKEVLETVRKVIKKEKHIETIPYTAKLMARAEIRDRVGGLVRGHFLMPLAMAENDFPALKKLRERFGKAPTISGQPGDFEKEVKTLKAYADSLEGLFTRLASLRKSFGKEFELDFLLNSACAARFDNPSLEKIFTAISEQQFSFIPKQLLQSIFPAEGRLPENTNMSDLTNTLVTVIGLEALSINQRAAIINTIYKNIASADLVTTLVQGLKEVKAKHPAIQENVLNLWLASFEATPPSPVIIEKTLALLDLFESNDPALVVIFQHLSTKEGIKDYNKLLEALEKTPDKDDKKAFLKIVAYACLERNYPSDREAIFEKRDDVEKGVVEENVIEELVEMTTTQKDNFNQLADLFNKAPYPRLSRLEQMMEWVDTIENYGLDPAGLRTDPINGAKELSKQFDISTIHQRIDAVLDLGRDAEGNPVELFQTHRERLFEGIAYITAVGKEYPLVVPGNSNPDLRKPVKDLDGAQIQALVQHYRKIISGELAVTPEQLWVAKLEYVALVREALYRAEGIFAYDTQILSLLNVILQGGNVFSEIRTGEGKSLITAFFAAYKWAEGGAVDVCSSNMSLAARDLEERKDFYDYLGIPTALIRASSSHGVYQQEGINYSDISELSLFQEQHLLEGNPLPDKVSCVFDEVDFTALDNTTSFRYATSLDAQFDPHYNPNEWVYPLILEFVSSKDFVENQCAKQQDIRNLQNFIKNHPTATQAEKAKFSNFENRKLDMWIDSAYTASKLRMDEDFVVRESAIIKGEQKVDVLVARVKINHRESEDSKFSDGVHQFLHARLNKEIADNPAAFKVSPKGREFPIEPEKTYLASRSAKNTLDYYLRPHDGKPARGNVLGLTGTMGSLEERRELQKNYGAKFFRIPPHQKLLRKDMDPIVTKSRTWFFKETAESAHFKAIYDNAMEAQRKGQPILIICDGVKSSQRLHDYFVERGVKENLQLHNGEQSDQKEKDVVAKAGRPGMITLSTPMFGRGTDIKLVDKAGKRLANPKDGLHVIATYISDDREYGQNIGRASRNGQPGTTRLILSETEFTSRGKRVPRGKENLRREIEAIRLDIAEQKGKERFERQLFADVKDQFFAQYVSLCRGMKAHTTEQFTQLKADPRSLWSDVSYKNHENWEKFLREIDTKWGELLTKFRNRGDSAGEEKAELLKELLKLTEYANKQWSTSSGTIVSHFNGALDKAYNDAYKNYSAAKKPAEATSVEVAAPESVPQEAKSFDYKNIPVSSSLSGITPEQEALNVSLESEATKPETLNLPKTYLEISQQVNGTDVQTERLKQKALENECNRLLEWCYSGTSLQSPDRLDDKLQVLAILLLKEHYDAYRIGHVTFPIMRALDELSQAIASYGTESQKKAFAQNFDKHLKWVDTQHKKDNKAAGYLLTMSRFKQDLSEIGAIPAGTQAGWMTQDKAEEKAWKQVYELAKERLTGYQNAWFIWRSSDRKVEAAYLLEQLEIINNSKDSNTASKLKDWLGKLDVVNTRMVATDLAEDKKRRIFSLRNTRGSRLHHIMDEVHEYTVAVSMSLGDSEKTAGSEEKIIDMSMSAALDKLLERTSMTAGLEKKLDLTRGNLLVGFDSLQLEEKIKVKAQMRDQLREQMRDQLRDQLRAQMKAEKEMQIFTQIEAEVKVAMQPQPQTDNLVSQGQNLQESSGLSPNEPPDIFEIFEEEIKQLQERVNNQIAEKEVDKQLSELNSEVDKRFTEEVDKQFIGEAGKQFEAEVDERLKEKVDKQFEAEVDKRLEEEVDERLKEANDAIKTNYQQLVLIHEQLNNCQALLQSQASLSHSEKAFLHHLRITINQVESVLSQPELACYFKQQRDSLENKVRTSLQHSLAELVLDESGHATSTARINAKTRYADIHVQPAGHALSSLQLKAMIEIERQISMIYPKVKGFKYSSIDCRDANGLTVTAKFNSDGRDCEFTMQVKGLTQGSHNVICEWPKVVVAESLAIKNEKQQVTRKDIPIETLVESPDAVKQDDKQRHGLQGSDLKLEVASNPSPYSSKEAQIPKKPQQQEQQATTPIIKP